LLSRFGTPLLLLCVSIAAQARALLPSALSYEQAVREATDKAPDVLIAMSHARAAHDGGPAPFGTPNPRLTVGTTQDGARETVSFYAFLPFFGRRQAAVATSEALAKVADVNIAVARLDARLAVALAWIDLWLAEQTAQLADLSRARRDRLLEIATERFHAGSAPRLDEIRARADALRQRAEVDALVPLQRAAGARLAFLLGRDVQKQDSELTTVGSLPKVDGMTALEVLLPKLQGHPAFLTAQASAVAEGVAVKTQRRQLWPFLGVQAGAALNERGKSGSSANDLNAAVLIEVPVYGVPQLKHARASQRAALDNMNIVMRRLSIGVVETHAQLEAASRRARAAVEEVVPSAEEMSQLAFEAYHEGSIDMTAAITTEQAYFDAQLAALQAQAECARASARLRHATGEQP
jgi:outer membrane protein TolC